MIRYHLLTDNDLANLATLADIQSAERLELETRITKINKNWLTDATARTAHFSTEKVYSETKYKPNWSKIKRAYMKIQASKCAYCEIKLEDGVIQHDVEHFRPKSNVKNWLNEKRKTRLKNEGFDINLPLGGASKGYYLLPYNIFNYITACKVCNSNLKSDYFPIKNQRQTPSDDFNLLFTEEPYLPYPLGHFDQDAPEDLISFNGHIAAINPIQTDQQKISRAIVTIVFFELNLRPYLLKQRSEVVKKIFEAFNDKFTHPDLKRRKKADKDLIRWQKPTSEHTNCARSFYKLCESDLPKAFEYYEKACQCIEDIEKTEET